MFELKIEYNEIEQQLYRKVINKYFHLINQQYLQNF